MMDVAQPSFKGHSVRMSLGKSAVALQVLMSSYFKMLKSLHVSREEDRGAMKSRGVKVN